MEMPEKVKEELEGYFEEHKVPRDRQESIRELVRGFYQRAAYDAEEPIGVVAAQSLSEPATQMSTSPFEKLILKRNERIAILKIGDFVDSIVERFGKSVNGWDVCDISSEGVYVPSITNDEKAKWSLVKEVSRHKTPKRLIRIKTFSGREITATDSHSFVIRKDNKIVPVAGSELNPGDRIPVMKYLPENCIEEIKISDIVPHRVQESSGLIYSNKNSNPVCNRLELDSLFGWFIGAYLSEGSAQGSQIGITNTDESFASNAKAFAERIGLGFKEIHYMGEYGKGRTVVLNSTILSKFIISICGRGSRYKKIPTFAYNAREEFVSGLLRGYFDGDGNVHPDRKTIRASSNSKELLDGICLLLARFGIFAHKVKAKTQYGLLIPYKYAPVFLEKIGSDIPKKRAGLERMSIQAEDYWNRKSQDFTDMATGFGAILHNAATKLRYPTRYVNNFTNRQRIGRTTLQRYIRLFERLAEERSVDISSELKIMRTMFNSDFVWDRIVSIDAVKPDYEYVYDLTVPGAETFTTLDGIVTHNTMRTYHFAGTAGIQVTLGLPRMLEIFDARKEPRTPTMTVFLKPEHQSIEEVRKIASQIREVRAKDVILSTTLDLTELWIKCRVDLKKLESMEIAQDKVPKLIKTRNVDVSMEGPDTILVKSKKADLRNLHKLKYSVLESHIKGIKGISQVVVTKEGGEWIINTLGSNLSKVFEIEGVDYTRTFSNNIFEVYDVLGSEAARNVIIKQAQYTMEEQGLGVDVRYIMLLADIMCVQGDVRAIGRYGISGQKSSVLVRASFEETKKHLTAASIKGERDDLHGTVENIMMNQVAPIGTGAFHLVGSIPEFPRTRTAKPAKKARAVPKAAKKPAVRKPAKPKPPAKAKPVKPAPKKKPAKPKPPAKAKPAKKPAAKKPAKKK